MEKTDRRSLFYDFHHPYTEGLLSSLPVPGRRRRLTPIAGQPPSAINRPPGCPFSPRCRYVFDRCLEQAPPLLEVSQVPPHRSACWLPTAPEERAKRQHSLWAADDAAPQDAVPQLELQPEGQAE
jgi:oligopeptide/dipeptide ABC transporter ATP-binding protein